MTRETIIAFLAEDLDRTKEEIDTTLKSLYKQYNDKCCQELVEDAFDDHTIVEYRACRLFLQYLCLGE